RRLRWAIRHRVLVVGGAAGSLVLAVVLFMQFNAGVEFFPESIPPRTVYVQVEVPGGTNAAFTNGIAEEIERRLPGIPGIEDAASVVATVRQSTGGADMMGTGASPANVAVNFKVYQE